MTKSSEESVEKAIRMVKNKKELEPYLISKLIEKSNPEYFALLRDNDFFSNDKIPIVGEDGYTQRWNVLNYVISILDILIEKSMDLEISYIIDMLIRISDINNNYMVFEQCINIFGILPSKYYELNTFSSFLNKQINKIDNKELIAYILIDYLLENDIFKGADERLMILKNILNICKHKEVDNRKYILERILSGIDAISEGLHLDILMLVMQLLELELYEEESNINILDNYIKLKLYKDKICLILNGECMKNNITIERHKAILEIIDVLRYKISVNYEELEIRVKSLYSQMFSKENYYSIFQSKNYFISDSDVLTEILKKITRISKESLTDVIDKALKNNYDHIKKIGIYMLVHEMEKENEFLIKDIISKYDFDYMIRDYSFDDEIKHIFNKLSKFNTDDKTINIIDNYISKGEYIKYDNYDEIWKQKRYEALKNIDYFKKKYKDIKLITGIDVELKPALSIECRDVLQKSPFKVDEILNMSVDQLVDEMTEFKEYYTDSFEEMSCNSFCNVLRESILLDYNKYLYDIDKFYNVGYEFILTIVETLAEIIMKERTSEIIKLIKFIRVYIENINDDTIINKNKRISSKVFKKRIFRILSDLLANDDILMDNKFYDEVINLIQFVSGAGEEIEISLMKNNDYYSYFLNSYEGSLMILILELALKCTRQGNIQTKHWKEPIISVLNKLSEDKYINLYFIVGRYFNQFRYLDEAWTIGQVEKFINEDQWAYFIGGYLYSNQVIRDNWVLLDQHIEKALKFKFEDKNIRKRLIQHITIAYMNEFNIKKTQHYVECIINDFNTNDIKELIKACSIIDFNKMVKEIKPESVSDKILSLWSRIIERQANESSLDDEIKEVLSQSLQMLKIINEFNEKIKDNIIFCARKVKYNNYYDVVIYIYDIILSKTDKIFEDVNKADLFNKFIYEFMYEFTPRYPEMKVVYIMKFLNEYKHEGYKLVIEKYIEKYKEDVYFIKSLNQV